MADLSYQQAKPLHQSSGHKPDKLYHSYMVFGSSQRIGALVKGMQYYVRVDAFNENGITQGQTVLLKAALTDKINDRDVYMKGIDASYHYEGYNIYKTEELKNERNNL